MKCNGLKFEFNWLSPFPVIITFTPTVLPMIDYPIVKAKNMLIVTPTGG